MEKQSNQRENYYICIFILINFLFFRVDVNGKPHRIHKVITTTTTVTCFGGVKKQIKYLRILLLLIIEDDIASKDDQTAEEKFVEHVKELGVDTKDVLLHTATNVQHALGTASDYIRTQLSSTTSENTEIQTTKDKDQNNLVHQASALKDVIIQKAIDVKDATVDVIKDLATPQEQSTTVNFHQGTATVTTEKKQE